MVVAHKRREPATMKVHPSALYGKLFWLLPHHRLPGSLLSPHRLLRQYSCSKTELVTAVDLVSYWKDVFEANGIPEAQASSEYIVSHILGAKTFQSLSASSISTPLSAKQRDQVQQLCAKRLQRMPVQYVLGEWDFQDLTLKMKPPVFIPRPETESRVVAIDKLEAAVNLTKENAERLQLQKRVKILHHDVFSSSWEYLLPWGLVDTIVSNPPYIFHEDMSHLAAEILRYEDLGALEGGLDGMNVIKEVLNLTSYILKDLGSVFLEVDPRHPEMVKTWLHSHPDLSLFVSATHKDFCGKPRFLHIQKYQRRS
ncbi:MTRF1L release factor glutamine methyltransferase isoform X2 [Paroedura picta]|uniref:MTRF1L release factor glutamine methyltransferase isoform X2 n=1 Tax=Paroedura picta TaxID=143630 RepID=UPI0040561BDD